MPAARQIVERRRRDDDHERYDHQDQQRAVGDDRREQRDDESRGHVEEHRLGGAQREVGSLERAFDAGEEALALGELSRELDRALHDRGLRHARVGVFFVVVVTRAADISLGVRLQHRRQARLVFHGDADDGVGRKGGCDEPKHDGQVLAEVVLQGLHAAGGDRRLEGQRGRTACIRTHDVGPFVDALPTVTVRSLTPFDSRRLVGQGVETVELRSQARDDTGHVGDLVGVDHGERAARCRRELLGIVAELAGHADPNTAAPASTARPFAVLKAAPLPLFPSVMRTIEPIMLGWRFSSLAARATPSHRAPSPEGVRVDIACVDQRTIRS